MARRSELDLEVGDDIRAFKLVACPQCLVETIWHGVNELADHLHDCRVIELGLAVGVLELPPLDDLLPEVDRKPKGWGWGDR